MTHSALEIRCNLAMSKLVQTIYSESHARAGLVRCICDAYDCGRDDFQAGESRCPALFKDEPLLVRAWKDGFAMGYTIARSPDGPQMPQEWNAAHLLASLNRNGRAEIDDVGLFELSVLGCEQVLRAIVQTANREREWAHL